jgi:Icc-related predicted phosphoesterase
MMKKVADAIERGDVTPKQLVLFVLSGIILISFSLCVMMYFFVSKFIASLLAIGGFVLGARWFSFNALGVFGIKGCFVRDFSDIQKQLISPSTTNPKDSIRFVCISDTHGKHRELKLPDGDVLLHCGDFTDKGTHEEIMDFNEWLGTLPYSHKIVVAGNHDLSLDAAEYEARWGKEWHHKTYNDPNISVRLLTNCIYLENRGTEIEGIKIYGSPMSPPIPGRVMAFNLDQGLVSKTFWSKLPADTDILITHSPPKGILDKTFTGLRVGDESLMLEVLSKCRPKFHVFGHIHEGYGIVRVANTFFLNVSSCTLTSEMKHDPICFDMPIKI